MFRILGDRRVDDPGGFRENLQGSQSPVRSPFLPLVTLILHELGIPVSQAKPKLFRILLRLLDLRVEECGRALQCSDLEVFR